jgi:hypothetical protein
VVQIVFGAHPASYLMGNGGGGVNLATNLQLVLTSRNMYLYIHSPIGLHGVMINKYRDYFSYCDKVATITVRI